MLSKGKELRDCPIVTLPHFMLEIKTHVLGLLFWLQRLQDRSPLDDDLMGLSLAVPHVLSGVN